ncbi:hypothetical protein IFU02_020930 [Pantoea agglomerans]|uniref:hypothetical protein n=1 Tax=Enterobacter agglomerans TaxID=549 RepID=UPI00177FD3E8|nr:hypothetical protein [Pantoea agglomerans]WVL84907.1 hypothetical protein IFU02_020930 [Pantoea agglomerans]
MEKLNELKEAFYPQYGTPGSRDMDVTARRKVIDENIEAVAEAFRAQEQRAEAAEAESARRARDYKHVIEQHMPRTSEGCVKGWSRVIEAHELQAKLEAAGAKLAEMEKQEPDYYATQCRLLTKSEVEQYRRHNLSMRNLQRLFKHPAPAADLADLVPGEFPAMRLQKAKLWIDLVLMDKPGMKEAQTISAILRNIEEAK